MTSRAILVCLSGLLALGSSACVETAEYDKTVAQLDQARRVVAYKDQQIQAFQWQLTVLGQQLREAQARSEAQQRDLTARLQHLGETNAELAWKLQEATVRKEPFPVAEEPPQKSAALAHPEELRRLIASVEARNAQLAESIARIERLLGSPGTRGDDDGARRARGVSGDLVDPWGFGTRK
jgi:hypothetical protein